MSKNTFRTWTNPVPHGDESCRDDCDLDRSVRRGPRSGPRGDGGPAWGDADRRPDDLRSRRDGALHPPERAPRSRLRVVRPGRWRLPDAPPERVVPTRIARAGP